MGKFRHILLHLWHLNHGRQYKGHIKDRFFHGVLHLSPTKVVIKVTYWTWHSRTVERTTSNHEPKQYTRQSKSHIKDGCFHGVLLAIRVRVTQSARVASHIKFQPHHIHILLHLSHLHQWRQGEGHIKEWCFHSQSPNKLVLIVTQQCIICR